MEHHITVFRNEAVDALRIKPDSTIVDATVGSGGHTQHIVSKLGKQGLFVGIDADSSAINTLVLSNTEARTHLTVGNFRDLKNILGKLHISNIDGIIADLGWRIEQFTGSKKGFSFTVDEPLHMTYGDPELYLFDASDIVNGWEREDIENVIKGYGEERYFRKIAQAIVEERAREPIRSSGTLARVISEAVSPAYRNGKIHPATKTFQALRIAVNDELEALTQFIQQAIEILRPGGRLAIITFHSLEDRIVKHAFKDAAHDGRGVVVTKRPMVPSDEELKTNRRARSAKLRIFEKHA